MTSSSTSVYSMYLKHSVFFGVYHKSSCKESDPLGELFGVRNRRFLSLDNPLTIGLSCILVVLWVGICELNIQTKLTMFSLKEKHPTDVRTGC